MMPTTSTLSKDASGGLISAILGMPGNLAIGLILFSAVDGVTQSQALMAGMVCALAGGLCALLFSRVPAMITGPGVVSAIVLASGLDQILGVARDQGWDPTPEQVVFLAAIILALAGLMQVGFGLARLGRVIRYTPHPVLAGLLSGAGVVIALGQARHLIAPETGLPALGIAALSAAAMIWGTRLVPLLPGPVLALAVGGATYYGLMALGLGVEDGLGSRLTALDAGPMATVVGPGAADALNALGAVGSVLVNSMPLLMETLKAAATVAVLSTLNSLIALAGVERVVGTRAALDREVAVQGVTNLVAGLAGGAPTETNLGRTKVNHAAGGRTRGSLVVYTAAVALVLILTPGVTGLLPQPVLAGMIVALGVSLWDPWILASARRLVSERFANRELLANLGVALVVVAVSLWADMILAVMAGAGLAILLYIRESSARSVRRVAGGDTVRSHRQRDPASMAVLAAHGHEIQVVTLEGGLFFGSVEAIRERLEGLANQGARSLVLDFRRVSSVDLSASVGLIDIATGLRKRAVMVVLCQVPPKSELTVLASTLDAIRQYDSVKHALEDCEDHLLARHAADVQAADLPDLNRMMGLDQVPEDQACMVIDHLERRTWPAGARVLAVGDPADAVYFVAAGIASLSLPATEPAAVQKTTQPAIPLASFGKGAFFGESAFFGDTTHGVAVEARSDLVAYRLSRESFLALGRAHPMVAQVILAAISASLTQRLRQAFVTIAELEEGR